MKDQGSFVCHAACEDCGGSDCVAVYDSGFRFCHGQCNKQKSAASVGEGAQKTQKSSPRGLLPVTFTDLGTRKLREETCRFWGYGISELRGKPVQVATYCDESGSPVAQKVRTADKKFTILGDAKKMGLYGKHLCRDKGRKIVVTEGELDALSVSQAQGLKWPVVSVPNGAQSAARAVALESEWLSNFDEVVFMFDNDDPGRKAAVACCEALPPGKGKVAHLNAKYSDPSEALQANDAAAIIDAMWGAKTHRPDGIVDSEQMLQMVRDSPGLQKIADVPFPVLQEKTMGLCRGQVWCVTSGSGMGKTEFCRELGYSVIQQVGKLGYIALEEPTERTAIGLAGLHLNKRLHLRSDAISEPGFMEAWDEVITDKLFCYDHFGTLDGDVLVNKLRYMIVAFGIDVLILDHLSIVVSGMEDDSDERRTIDRIMTRLKSLAIATRTCIIVVSHLKRPPGVPHEEGGQTSLGQLRGSAAIGQLSNVAIGLERDQQDPDRSDITTIRILKNRDVGITGLAGEAVYSHETGRMLPYFEGLQVSTIDCSTEDF